MAVDLHSVPFRWSFHTPPYRIAGVLELGGNGTYFVEGSPHAAAMPCNLNVRGNLIRKKPGTEEFIFFETPSEKFIVGFIGNKWLRIDLVATHVPSEISEEPNEQGPSQRPRPLLRPRPVSLRQESPPRAEPDSSEPLVEESKPAVAEPQSPPSLPPFSVRRAKEVSVEKAPLGRLTGWLNNHGLLVGVVCISATLVVDTFTLFAPRKKPATAGSPQAVRLRSLDTEYRTPFPAAGGIDFPSSAKQRSRSAGPQDRSPSWSGMSR